MTTRDTILVVDDEPSVRQVLCVLFEEEGFNVIQAADGVECLQKAYEHHPDLVVLDLKMPNKDGRVVCQQLREMSDVPVIILTGEGKQVEKVERLRDGADDYIVKPFDADELIARVRAVLRRARRSSPPRVYQDGSLYIDLESYRVRVAGKPVELTLIEWRLLERLLQNRERVVTREELQNCMWGQVYEGDLKNLKVYILHLRKKLGDLPRRSRYICNVRGIGYRFVGKK